MLLRSVPRSNTQHAPEGEAPAIADVSDDARAALQILERALGRSAPATPSAAPALQSAGVLIVPYGAASFRLGSDPPVDLSRRTALRQILDVLAQHHERAPGEPLDVGRLIAAGWPSEKIARSSALNRLHVALATLRSLGLRDVLLRQGEGYLLDPSVTLCRSTSNEDESGPISGTVPLMQEGQEGRRARA